MAERSKAAVLKTVVGRPTGGSNPSLSAIILGGIIPAGAKIEPTGLGRPLRTTEIPRAGKKGKRMIEIAKKQSLR